MIAWSYDTKLLLKARDELRLMLEEVDLVVETNEIF